MKRSFLVLSVVGVLVFALACNFLSPDADVTRESEPISVGEDGFTVTLNNATADDICYVLISPSDEESWGEDWLDDNEVIAAGTRQSFSIGEAVEHDLMALNCDEVTVATAWGLSSDTTVTVGGGGLSKLEVRNDSSEEICYAYFSPSSSDAWGEDWLGIKESILPNGGVRFFYVEPGTYDLLVQDCNGEDLVQKTEVDLSSDVTWTINN